MEIQEKDRFLQMLTKAMGAYGKEVPEGSILSAWWEILKPYPLRVVSMAFAAYCDENGEFAPVPAGIAKRCKLMDGRPTDEEAWAIALTSRSEEDTVIWTSETAEAFAACSPVLAMGDEVGARMAFKDTYNRLVSAARIAGKPAAWNVSLGWDIGKREAAIEKAAVAGLLPAPTAHALLPHHIGKDGKAITETCPEGLTRLKAEMAKMKDAWTAAAERRTAELEAQREAEAKRKQEIAAKVSAYGNNTAA